MRIKSLLLLLAIFSVLFVSGCASGGKPKTPVVISSSKIGYYTENDFERDYNAYKLLMCVDNNTLEGRNPNCTQQPDTALTLRDVIINRVRSNIDKNYHDFESDLFFRRASSNILGDFLELGLDAAGAISGGARVKSIIAISNSAVKGTRISIDKNLFAERTTEIIISKMQESRDRIKGDIITKMAVPVNRYPLEEAFDDLVNYFYAGTLQSGIQALANDAGQAAAIAREDTRELERSRVPTPTEVKRAVDVRGAFERLRTAARNSSDRTAQDAAIAKITNALRTTGALDELGANPTTEQKIEALRKLVIRSRNDSALLEQLAGLLASDQPAPSATPTPSPSPSPTPGP